MIKKKQDQIYRIYEQKRKYFYNKPVFFVSIQKCVSRNLGPYFFIESNPPLPLINRHKQCWIWIWTQAKLRNSDSAVCRTLGIQNVKYCDYIFKIFCHKIILLDCPYKSYQRPSKFFTLTLRWVGWQLTAESDSAVSKTPRLTTMELTQWCPAHRGVT